MKILWLSDSPTHPTRSGNITHYVCAGLADCGHQVSILGFQTRRQEQRHNCTLYPFHLQSKPTMHDLSDYLNRLRPDVFVMQGDVQWFPQFNQPVIVNVLRASGITWALYYAIPGELSDGRFQPGWIGILKTIDLPIAMNRYVVQMSQANGVSPAYIPVGVDTETFHPVANKELAKQALGYDGRFVVLVDVSNYRHKQLPRMFEIFRRFAEGRDDVLLHLQCDPNDPLVRSPMFCYELQAGMAALDFSSSKVRLTPGMSTSTKLSLAQLAQVYQAVDVQLLASVGEAFSLPMLQAAASGVVPMALDYAVSPEPVLARRYIDIDDAVSRLEQLYRDRERLSTKAQQAHSFA
jgi:glycosyltransferase involved in cell wall biosynthesis